MLAGSPSPLSVEESYERCAALARSHYENFTVASRFLPVEMRRHLYAIYAFCRTVDDLGDEYPGDRIHALDLWEQDLLRCYGGTPRHPYLAALKATVARFDIPEEPFLRLIEANRMDQRVTRYRTYGDLERYCENSANPVGRLVLYVSGYRDEPRQLLSDATCTALQLTNFWQDIARDHEMGRIYLPLADLERFGYTEHDLDRRVVNDAFRELMAFQLERTRALFRRGGELLETLDGRVRLDVALFSAGGLRVLEMIEDRGYDVLSSRPALSGTAKLMLMAKTLARLSVLRRV